MYVFGVSEEEGSQFTGKKRSLPPLAHCVFCITHRGGNTAASIIHTQVLGLLDYS